MTGHRELSLSLDFNTSGSNYAKIHLSSDSLANGYYVKVGCVDDEVSLYKLTSGQSTKIIDGTDDFLDFSSNNLSLMVDRDSVGNWMLKAKRSIDLSYFVQGQTFYDSHLQSGYKGRLLIFDAKGFPIRTVVNNELFGTDNLYFWDGLTDRKEAAAIGRYILLLEATQSSLPPIIEKKTAVVGR